MLRIYVQQIFILLEYYVYVCERETDVVHAYICVHMETRDLPLSILILFFKTGSLTEPEAYHFSKSGWPLSYWDPPASASQCLAYRHLNLGSLAFTTSTLTHKAAFSAPYLKSLHLPIN